MLKRHPEFDRKSAGHVEFAIVLPTTERGYNCFGSVKANGEVETFSYETCLTGRGWTEARTLKHVLRRLIIDQIMEFRETNPNACSICGISDLLDIDHITPFVDIAEEWIRDEMPEEVNIVNDCEFEDARLNCSWQEFHKKKACLQFLCQEHHKHKTFRQLTKKGSKTIS